MYSVSVSPQPLQPASTIIFPVQSREHPHPPPASFPVMAATLEELTAVEEIGPGRFRSKAFPETMANPNGVAYGGCALGIATRAAYATVPASHALYSLVGHYLGPTRTADKIECVVHTTRDTRTFATRRIEVRQTQPDGSTRVCLEMLADFHVREKALVTYSGPIELAEPGRTYDV